MKYSINQRQVSQRHLAVVRDRRSWSQLGGQLIPLLDRVYAAVKAGKVVKAGHNVFLYRDGTKDSVTVEIGVEVASPFDEVDGVAYSVPPSGEAVSTVHVGAYSGLSAAYDALIGWCKERHLTRAGVWWEVYGDWHEDPAQVETEVFYLLRTEAA